MRDEKQALPALSETKNLKPLQKRSNWSCYACCFTCSPAEKLSDAIEDGQLDIVLNLLESKKISPNSKYANSTPLEKCLLYKRFEIALALLERGADPNAMFDFSAWGSDRETIIQSEVDIQAYSNVVLLGLYGARPDGVNFSKNPELENVLSSAYHDFIDRCKFEKILAGSQNDLEKKAALDALIKIWDKYAKSEKQPVYQKHYEHKVTEYQQMLEEFHAEVSPP